MGNFTSRVQAHNYKNNEKVQKLFRWQVRAAYACETSGIPYAMEWQYQAPIPYTDIQFNQKSVYEYNGPNRAYSGFHYEPVIEGTREVKYLPMKLTAVLTFQGSPNVKPLPKEKTAKKSTFRATPADANLETQFCSVQIAGKQTMQDAFVVRIGETGLALTQLYNGEETELAIKGKSWTITHGASGLSAVGNEMTFANALKLANEIAPMLDWTLSKDEIAKLSNFAEVGKYLRERV